MYWKQYKRLSGFCDVYFTNLIIMRNITEKAVNALFNNRNFKLSNTEVEAFNNISTMYLHWNRIATLNHNTNVLEISTAGWETTTTKERLNWVLSRIWKYIKQRVFEWKVFSNSEYPTTKKEFKAFWEAFNNNRLSFNIS